jgi:hypothetical protein
MTARTATIDNCADTLDQAETQLRNCADELHALIRSARERAREEGCTIEEIYVASGLRLIFNAAAGISDAYVAMCSAEMESDERFVAALRGDEERAV